MKRSARLSCRLRLATVWLATSKTTPGGRGCRPALAAHEPVAAVQRPVPRELHGRPRIAVCAQCTLSFFVAFSCKRRGVCPSCNGRHMAQTAVQLVDHVIPPVPVLQWVISMPKRLRGFRSLKNKYARVDSNHRPWD